ncbi:hypothetical protein [Enterococcus sp. DIV1420a]|uniref:hypothetical protein n=1 Tax=Enterococcus TaxID=1350 RepID=UPI003F24EBC3
MDNKELTPVTHILLGNKKVAVNPKFNAFLLHQLRVKENYRTRLVLNAMIRDEEIDEMALIDAVFISYRNANPEGLTYIEFLKLYELDVEEAAPLLTAVLTKKGRNQFAQEFMNKTPKKQKPAHYRKSKSKK